MLTKHGLMLYKIYKSCFYMSSYIYYDNKDVKYLESTNQNNIDLYLCFVE